MAETKPTKKAAEPPAAKSERDQLIDLLQAQGVIIDKRWDEERLRQEYAALTGAGQQDAGTGGDAPEQEGDVELAAMEEGVEREGAHRAVCLRTGLHIAPADLADPGMSTRSHKYKSGDVIYFNNPHTPAALQAKGLVKVI
ncbi:hypothetical protein [Acidiphilium sp.]|uniref:hypothetical protein n=1 Tax=Acidiphilium sp. TaxID=527 RepID=UPI0025852DEE|nr:hypothetical protein [Acidiphilium sp.]